MEHDVNAKADGERQVTSRGRRRPARRRPRQGLDIRLLVAFALPGGLGLAGGAIETSRWGLVGVLAWGSLAVAAAFGLVPRSRPAPEAKRAVLLLLALIAWTGLSLAWTESAGRTQIDFARTTTIAAAFVVPLLGLNSVSWRGAAGGLTAALALVALLATCGRLVPDLLPVADTGDLGLDATRRLAYPIDYWNALGAWAAMGITAALAWSVHARGLNWRSLSLASVPITAAALYLTYSRGAIAALLAGISVLLVLSPRKRTLVRQLMIAIVACGFVVLVIRSQHAIANGTGDAGGLWVLLALATASAWCGLLARVQDRGLRWIPVGLSRFAVVAAALALLAAGVWASQALDAADPKDLAASGDPAARLTTLAGDRTDLWDSGLEAFVTRPIQGLGAGTFGYWWLRSDAGPDPIQPADAHSLYVEALAELGIVGLLAWGAFLVTAGLAGLAALRGARRSEDAGIIAGLLAVFVVLLVGAGVDWLWEVPAVSMAGVAAIGIATSAGAPPTRAGRVRGLRALGLVALAAAAVAVQVPSIAADQRLEGSLDAQEQDDLDLALQRASDAVRAAPWAADGYAQRARIRIEMGQWDEARADVELAIEREPTNWRHPVLLAHLEARAGDSEATAEALEDAAELRPALAERLRQRAHQARR